MIAIALIIGIVLVLVVVQKAIGSTVNSADRAIRRKTYESGKAEAATELVIYAPAPPREVIEEIVTTVNAHESAPAVVAGLYLKKKANSNATFALGNIAGGDHFVAQVALRDVGNESAGWFRVLAWKESGAEVYGRKEMAQLRENYRGCYEPRRNG